MVVLVVVLYGEDGNVICICDCVDRGDVGRSEVCMLKSVGDRTPPWGTPVLVLRFSDVVLCVSVTVIVCIVYVL